MRCETEQQSLFTGPDGVNYNGQPGLNAPGGWSMSPKLKCSGRPAGHKLVGLPMAVLQRPSTATRGGPELWVSTPPVATKFCPDWISLFFCILSITQLSTGTANNHSTAACLWDATALERCAEVSSTCSEDQGEASWAVVSQPRRCSQQVLGCRDATVLSLAVVQPQPSGRSQSSKCLPSTICELGLGLALLMKF